MRTRKFFGKAIFAFVLIISLLTYQRTFLIDSNSNYYSVKSSDPVSSSPWFNETAATNYVTNFTTDFNAIVQGSQGYFSNFSATQRNFTGYLSPGQNFQIKVMRLEPNNSNYVAFVFKPIESDQPQIVIDNTDTIKGLIFTFPLRNATFYFVEGDNLTTPYGFALIDYAYSYPAGSQSIPLAWVTPANNVLVGSPIYSAESAARALYTAELNQFFPEHHPSNTWGYVVIEDLLGVALIFWVPVFAYVRKSKSYSEKEKVLIEAVIGVGLNGLFFGLLLMPPKDFSFLSFQGLAIFLVLLVFGIFIFRFADRLLIWLRINRDYYKEKGKADKKAEKKAKAQKMKQEKAEASKVKKTKQVVSSPEPLQEGKES